MHIPRLKESHKSIPISIHPPSVPQTELKTRAIPSTIGPKPTPKSTYTACLRACLLARSLTPTIGVPRDRFHPSRKRSEREAYLSKRLYSLSV